MYQTLRHQVMRRAIAAGTLLTVIATGACAQPVPPGHMAETLRSAIARVVVIGGREPAEKEITGTYEETTPGLYGGIGRGAALGSPSMEIGPVNVSFPIPVLTLPGAIAGGISGKAKRELQEFRDALAEELAGAANQPLNNERLALGVYRNLERLPEPEPELYAESTPLPADADAVLYVSIDTVTIDIADEDAILTTTASLSLRNRSDGSKLYGRLAAYQDRAALTDWTANDNALFRDYANFALHYLGREIAAETFDGIELRHTLRPAGSASLKLAGADEWQGQSRSLTPALAWKLELLGGDSYGAWTEAIDETTTFYDVEIYDTKRLVYSGNDIPDPAHAVAATLEPCKTYRWSVRPVYRLDGAVRLGEWMRKPASGKRGAGLEMSGRNAAKAPAYVEDFATLTIDCRAR
jgi:hypothetical protein